MLHRQHLYVCVYANVDKLLHVHAHARTQPSFFCLHCNLSTFFSTEQQSVSYCQTIRDWPM